jgi:hypothetical protein
MSREIIPIRKKDSLWQDPAFSSSWEDMETIRTEIVAKNKKLWNNVDEDMEEFDKLVKRQHSDMDRYMTSHMPEIPPWALPEGAKDKSELFNKKSQQEGVMFVAILYCKCCSMFNFLTDCFG